MLLILWRGAKVQKDMVVDSSITLLKDFLLSFFLLSLRLISFYLRIMSTRSCYVRNSNSPAHAARLAQTWALAGYCFQFSVPKSPFLSDKFILHTSSLQLAASRRFWFIDYIQAITKTFYFEIYLVSWNWKYILLTFYIDTLCSNVIHTMY